MVSEEIKVTKEKLRRMAEECAQVDQALRRGFPEAFEKEWIDITGKVTFLLDSREGNGYYWLGMYEEGAIIHFGFIDGDGIAICGDDKKNYKVEIGRGKNGGTQFRILKRNE